VSRRRRAKDRSGPNLLDVRPRREADWEVLDGGRVLLVRRRPTVTPRALARWVWYMMAPARIRLDRIGSFAWLGIDGQTTVGELARGVRSEFGESAEPVEQRLGQFVRLLRRERFVSYPELDGEGP